MINRLQCDWCFSDITILFLFGFCKFSSRIITGGCLIPYLLNRDNNRRGVNGELTQRTSNDLFWILPFSKQGRGI